MSTYEQNGYLLEQDLNWLQTVIIDRISQFISPDNPELFTELSPPALPANQAGFFYADFVKKYDLTPEERLVVLLALAPELKPELLDFFLIRHPDYDKTYSEFGGIASRSFNGFIPTLKTALFVLGGSQLSRQIKYLPLFDADSKLVQADIFKKAAAVEEEVPACHRQLALSGNALSRILTGEDIRSDYSADFPARLLTTNLGWDDLILPQFTVTQLKELLTWPDYGRVLMDELGMKNVQAGYRALFYGPSGTGKTLTATLIGKKLGKPVYRIDLSQLVSKYIGETEKNLEKIFTAAENHDWILFFDEADALFGKRTHIGSSNDRFANQEIAYLLQRVEVCENMVILATNLKSNLDEAFARRFQSIIHFPVPEEVERELLWRGAFSKKVTLEKSINLKEIAKKYDISGGSINNVARYASLMAVADGKREITYLDLMDGIRREYTKLGRTV